MILIRRRAAIAAAAVLVALLGLAVAVGAQEPASVRVAGSAIAAPMVEAVAAEASVPVTLNIAGTTAGVNALCAGEADVVLTNRPLSAAEESVCASTGVSFYELLLGHAAAVVITNSASPAPQCLTSAHLGALFAPSSASLVTTWQQVDPNAAPDALSIHLPAEDSLAVALLDQVVEGEGLRTDASTLSSDADVISSVASEVGAVGVVDFMSVDALPDNVRVVELNTTAAGCTVPSTENFESRTYVAAAPLFAYVNAASEAALPLAEALANSGEAATAAGFAAPSSTAAELNASILAESNTGREFTRYITDFIIPEGASGAVLVAGSTAALHLTQSLSSAITAEFSGLVLTSTLQGEPAGINSLCTGAADIAFITSEASADLWPACTEANIEPMAIPVGGRPVVLVANAAADYLACLTPDEIAAAMTTDAASWDQVNPSFGTTPVTVLAPPAGNNLNDLLVRLTAGANMFLRSDVIENADPLYRAAAVANVEGAITFMDWNDYLRVVDNGQQGIQLVSVNDGADCIAPDEAAFQAGTYPLWEPVTLLVNPISLTKPAVQSALWYLFSDRNFNLLSGANLFGLAFTELAPLRYNLQDAFVAAEQAAADAAAAAAEATPEATAEATPAS